IDLPADSLCEGGLGLCTDPLGELRSRWLALYREIVRNRQWQLIFEILFHRCELVDESGEIRDRMLEGHGRGIDRVHRLLQQAVEAGQLAPDIDTRVAAHFLHAALIGLLHDWLLRPEAFDFATQGERFIDATLELIAHAPQLRRAQWRNCSSIPTTSAPGLTSDSPPLEMWLKFQDIAHCRCRSRYQPKPSRVVNCVWLPKLSQRSRFSL